MQLDLFDHRNVALTTARAALAELRLVEARRDLIGLRARYPDDREIAQELARVQRLLVEMSDVELGPSEALPSGLLDLARSATAGNARRALLRRTGQALRDARGDDGCLDEQPPGYFFLAAGDAAGARASLHRAIARAPRARFLALLADADLALGEAGVARGHYFEALLLDPFDAAIHLLADEEVRALPNVARHEMDIVGEPIAWAAAVGAVTGVLPVGRALALPPTQHDGVARARAFVDALRRAAATGSGADGILARREMKQHAPGLFAVYMERLLGS